MQVKNGITAVIGLLTIATIVFLCSKIPPEAQPERNPVTEKRSAEPLVLPDSVTTETLKAFVDRFMDRYNPMYQHFHANSETVSICFASMNTSLHGGFMLSFYSTPERSLSLRKLFIANPAEANGFMILTTARIFKEFDPIKVERNEQFVFVYYGKNTKEISASVRIRRELLDERSSGRRRDPTSQHHTEHA